MVQFLYVSWLNCNKQSTLWNYVFKNIKEQKSKIMEILF